MSTAIGTDAIRVLVDGNDLTEFTLSYPVAPNLKPNWGEIPSLNSANIILRSDEHQFDPIHAGSFFYTRNINDLTVEITQFDRPVWKGFTQDVKYSHADKKATLICDSFLQKQLNTYARLDSAQLTPAAAVKNILTLYGIEINDVSFSIADNILNDVPINIRVDPSVLDWQGTLGDILQLLCSAGVCRIYLNLDGTIGIDAYRKDINPVVSRTYTDRDFMKWPIVSNEQMDPIDGYSIKYIGGEFFDGQTTGKLNLDFGPDSAVKIDSQVGAVYTGSTWVELATREYYRIIIFVSKESTFILDLTSWVQIASAELGLNVPAEIIGIDNGNDLYSKLTLRIDKGIV